MTGIATPHNDDSQLVFTSSQAARYLGVSLATVRRWTDAGFLTGYRTPGGQRRFSREQLDGFIASLQRTDERAQPSRTTNDENGKRSSIRRVA
jgi:excisionase family DNA binding protein